MPLLETDYVQLMAYWYSSMSCLAPYHSNYSNRSEYQINGTHMTQTPQNRSQTAL